MIITIGGSLSPNLTKQSTAIMNTQERRIPTISVHYYVNGDKVSKRTYEVCKQSLQMMLTEPYTETKQRIPISRYSIHTIYELVY